MLGTKHYASLVDIKPMEAIAYLKPRNPEGSATPITLLPSETPVVRPYSDDLCICYLVDCDHHYVYVQQRHIVDAGIDLDALHETGLKNLRALVTERKTRIQPYGNVYAFLMGGDFEASAILLDELWEIQFRQLVATTYAAAIPARDVLAFCDSTSAEGIAELQGMIDRLWPKGDHLLTKNIQLWCDGKWEPSS